MADGICNKSKAALAHFISYSDNVKYSRLQRSSNMSDLTQEGEELKVNGQKKTFCIVGVLVFFALTKKSLRE